jgi:hypothetical protein
MTIFLAAQYVTDWIPNASSHICEIQSSVITGVQFFSHKQPYHEAFFCIAGSHAGLQGCFWLWQSWCTQNMNFICFNFWWVLSDGWSISLSYRHLNSALKVAMHITCRRICFLQTSSRITLRFHDVKAFHESFITVYELPHGAASGMLMTSWGRRSLQQ